MTAEHVRTNANFRAFALVGLLLQPPFPRKTCSVSYRIEGCLQFEISSWFSLFHINYLSLLSYV